MSFSFEAFKSVQICLISLLKPNGEGQKDVGSQRLQALRLAPDHVQGLWATANWSQSSKNKTKQNPGFWRVVRDFWSCLPFKNWQNRAQSCWAQAFSIHLVSLRMAAPSKQRTYFPAGSHIFQWWHPKATPVVLCWFWRDAAWLLLLLQRWVVCQ